jgi:hypothetical protein
VEEAIEEVGVGCMVGRWTISTAMVWRRGDCGGGRVVEETDLMFAS